MITSLKITNFQSHKDSSLEFDPGVNVIVGPSDSGKTAILRALRWLIWNRPGGDAFRSNWGGETIETNDPYTISRSKDKENLYTVDHLDWEKSKVLKAFGQNVPEEIQKALNIDDTNFQKQFDSPFLLSKNPGEVARYFNEIAHLEKIDSANSYVKGKISALTSKEKADKESKKEYEEQLKQYAFLDKFEIDLEELEHSQESLTTSIASRKRLKNHLASMELIDERIEKLEGIISLQSQVDSLLELHKEQKELKDDQFSLKATLFSIQSKIKEEDTLKKKIELLPQVEALLQNYKVREALIEKQSGLRSALREIRQIKEKQATLETDLKEKEELFHKHMPQECPLCGHKTN